MSIRSTFTAGLAVTVGAVVLIAATAAYGLGAGVIVGLAVGAAVALVPVASGPAKITGLLVGMVVGALGYALRAGILPDSLAGTLLGIGAVLLVLTLISAISRGRLPLWTSLMGLAAIAGAYETLHIIDFAGLIANLPVAAAGTILAAAVGFTAAALFAPAAPGRDAAEAIDAEAVESIESTQSVESIESDREPVLV